MIIEGVMNLVAYGSFGGGAIGNLLAQWQASGFFAYALPFLLIFALVFAILGFIPIFKVNKGINVVISLATALMALQSDFVSVFSLEIFPRLGVALFIVLVALILIGLLIQNKKKGNMFMRWVLAIVMVAVTIWVIASSVNSLGFGFGGSQLAYFFRANLGVILTVAFTVGMIIAIVVKRDPKPKKGFPINIKGFGAK